MHDADLLASETARFEEVCRFGRERLRPVAATVAAAFADDPIWKWLHHCGDDPIDPGRGLALAEWLVAAMSPVDEIHGFRHHDAVALWHAPLTADAQAIVAAHESTLGDFEEALGAAIGDRLALAGELNRAMRAHRPAEPHWYLGVVATHPSRQGEGLGSRVMQAMHERCDRLGVPCYLESSNPQNYGLYRRHGYVETAEFHAADSPPIIGFWRAPR